MSAILSRAVEEACVGSSEDMSLPGLNEKAYVGSSEEMSLPGHNEEIRVGRPENVSPAGLNEEVRVGSLGRICLNGLLEKRMSAAANMRGVSALYRVVRIGGSRRKSDRLDYLERCILVA